MSTRGRKTRLQIHLCEEHRLELEAWQRSTTIPAGLARRGRAILLLAEGLPVCHVSERVGMQRRHIYKWAARFLARSLEGLREAARGPVPRRMKA
jgi:putative transposase